MCLDREQRIVIVLGMLFGVPQREAAAVLVLGITPGAYRVRLHRARIDSLVRRHARRVMETVDDLRDEWFGSHKIRISR